MSLESQLSELKEFAAKEKSDIFKQTHPIHNVLKL